MEATTKAINAPEEDEIDLLALIQKIWSARKRIFLITLVFLVIGILIALFSAKEYTATTIVVPQTESKGGSNLGGLAALAGISIGGGSSEMLPLTTYPKIVESVPFRKKLAQTKLTFSDIPQPITYEEYCQKHTKPSLMGRLMSVFSSTPAPEPALSIADTTQIMSLSKEERGILNSIDTRLKINLNEKEGLITLSCAMPEALPSAQMLQAAQQLLQETVTEFKLQKAKEEYDFVRQRCAEAEKEAKEKQYAVAQFQDRNRDLFSNLPQTRLQQLQAEYNLAFSVYTELAKQLETKRIKLKEDQPIFTIIEPVSVPNERSKPNRIMIIAIWMFIGLVVGIGSVFISDFRKQLKAKQQAAND
nr:Wzz/FepE/Etk N-terminal domain-containing protein [uncultured Capnocytophaga sp.]